MLVQSPFHFIEIDPLRDWDWQARLKAQEFEFGYALTVHKSQGSEFRHTVLALPRDGGGVLARELIYTGITRARDFFTLLTPSGQVLLEAIGQRTQRASGLRGLLER